MSVCEGAHALRQHEDGLVGECLGHVDAQLLHTTHISRPKCMSLTSVGSVCACCGFACIGEKSLKLPPAMDMTATGDLSSPLLSMVSRALPKSQLYCSWQYLHTHAHTHTARQDTHQCVWTICGRTPHPRRTR